MPIPTFTSNLLVQLLILPMSILPIPQLEHLDTKNGVGEGNNWVTLAMKMFSLSSISPKARYCLDQAGVEGTDIMCYVIGYTRRIVDNWDKRTKAKVPSLIEKPVEHLSRVRRQHPGFNLKTVIEDTNKLSEIFTDNVVDGSRTDIRVNRSKAKTDRCSCRSCRSARSGVVHEPCDYRHGRIAVINGCKLFFRHADK